MTEVISIAAGFVLTTIAGGWWASTLQQRSWERQNQLRLQEEDLRRAGEVCDEVSRLLDKRLYRMRRLFWAVEALADRDAASGLDARLGDYDEVLYEWNDRLNANLALVGSSFGPEARRHLFDLYEQFREVGRQLEAALRLARQGHDPSMPLRDLDPQFEGWSPWSLNGRVYELGLLMATQLRDGIVGRNAPEGRAGSREKVSGGAMRGTLQGHEGDQRRSVMAATNVWMYRESLSLEPDRIRNLVGYDVEATDGHIGKIDEASTETSRQYMVVDTGFWIFGKKRLVPAGVVDRVDHEDQKVFVSMTKDQIKNAPDYEAERTSEDDVYYDKFGGYYGQFGR